MQTTPAKANTLKGNLLFNFDDMSKNGKADKVIRRQFEKRFIGVENAVVNIDFSDKTKRAAGIPFKEVQVSFFDTQQIILRVKKSGDVYEVLLDGKILPLKNQDDHPKAFDEIVHALNSNRTTHEAKQNKLKMAEPKTPRTTKSSRQVEQEEMARNEQIKNEIVDVGAKIAQLDDEIAPLKMQVVAKKNVEA